MPDCRRSGIDPLRVLSGAPVRVRARGGFTLIELMLVTMILSVLAILAAGPVIKARQRAMTAAARVDLARAIRAVEVYQAVNHGQLPSAMGDLASVDYAPSPQIVVCFFRRHDAATAPERYVEIDMKHRGSDAGVATEHPTWGGLIAEVNLGDCAPAPAGGDVPDVSGPPAEDGDAGSGVEGPGNRGRRAKPDRVK
jgi:prepilin-type N-terminal cleavage/methylation domain-containing protein